MIKDRESLELAEQNYELESIGISFSYLRKVNYALQQNAISLIQSISIYNGFSHALHNVRISIVSAPTFLEPVMQRIDLIPANSSYTLNDIPVRLEYKFLAELSERVNAELHLKIFAAESHREEGKEFFREIYSIEVFASDEWLGSDVMPSMLAAFITPNLDIISQLQSRMTSILTREGRANSLEGYQFKNKERVYDMIEAAYMAVAEQQINYANHPASFATNGQRVRFGDAIVKHKLANCLDLSLFFAGLLEQCGLNPLVLLHEGHAYVGCHLMDYNFPESFRDDLQAVRKRVELDEILVFEATAAISFPLLPFHEAKSMAIKHLTLDAKFHGALDVRHARVEKIRPLPLRRNSEGAFVIDAAPTPQVQVTLQFGKGRCLQYTPQINSVEDKQTRIGRWQQRLLDLSKKNKLLNFKKQKNCIPIAFEALDVLEDRLSMGGSFTLHPANQMMEGTDQRNLTLLEKETGENPVSRYLDNELTNKRIHSRLNEADLSRGLLELYRNAKSSIEEGGVNTLFLSMGILEWKETSAATTIYRAPILLLPMKLDRKSVQEGFFIESADEDPIINVTLLEMIKRDFGKIIKGIDPLPADANGIDVKKVLYIFKQEVKDLHGWEVRDEAWLSTFSFKKFIMWSDLSNRIDDLQRNSIVSHLVNHPTEAFEDGIEPIISTRIDADFSYDRLFCPLSVDSSQLSAILSAEKGKNMVLHGPPGTGKSQTIANIISHCLAAGKKVLFVSEKRAALEVVHRRLCQIGLRPFCLELHSNKSGKSEVLEQFKETIDFMEKKPPEDWDSVTRKLERIKKELNTYVAELHKDYPSGFSPYRSFSYLMTNAPCKKNTKSVPALTFSVLSLTREGIEQLRDIAEEMATYSIPISDNEWHGFKHIGYSDWTPSWERDALNATTKLRETISSLKETCMVLFPLLGYDRKNLSKSDIYRIAFVADRLKEAADVYPEGFYSSDWPDLKRKLLEFIRVGGERDKQCRDLCDYEISKIYKLNSGGIRNRLSGKAGNIFILNQDACFSEKTLSSRAPHWAVELHSTLNSLKKCIQEVTENARKVFVRLGIAINNLTELDVQNIVTLVQIIRNAPPLPPKFIGGEWGEFSRQLKKGIEVGQTRDFLQNALSEYELCKVLLFDPAKAKTSIVNNESRMPLLRFFANKFLLAKVRRLQKNKKKKPLLPELPELLTKFETYISSQAMLRSVPMDFVMRLGAGWNNGAANWDHLSSILHYGEKLDKAIIVAAGDDAEAIASLRTQVALLLISSKDEMQIIEEFDFLVKSWEAYQDKFDTFMMSLGDDNFDGSKLAKGKSLFDEFCFPDDLGVVRKCGLIKIGSFISQFTAFISRHAQTVEDGYLLREYIEPWTSNGTCKWLELNSSMDFIDSIDEGVTSVHVDSCSALADMRNKIGNILSLSDKLLSPRGVISELIYKLITQWNDFAGDDSRFFISAFSLSPEFYENEDDCLDRFTYLTNIILANCQAIRNWCFWQRAKKAALEANLSSIVEAIEQKEIEPKLIRATLEERLNQKFIDEVIDTVKPLREFMGATHDNLVAEFQKLDERYAKLASQSMVAKIAARLPGARRSQNLPSGTELGILTREIAKKSRHKAVRVLFEDIPNILPTLKPCMLMSPLSVAQYLPARQECFDLVIFDEASQIPVWDAIGAIARGKQLIVVGDPKQLPPTNFFQRQDEEELGEDEIEEQESILDECRAARLYESHLRWHYRSRHEALIAFSNYHYYDNRLLTFPAANNSSSRGVKFRFVENGLYQARMNKPEASILVDEVVALLRDPTFAGKSIGIVTFNMSQQELIEDLLDEKRQKHPEIEKFFDRNSVEPAFVKNLENVQGDERDVIYFSMGYGYDENKKLSMYFGPLNNSGGERRLNVAITRAKEQVVVYSSIKSKDIDLSRTNAVGVAKLKHFLDYAEHGPGRMSEFIQHVSVDEYDSMFEKEVADFVRGKGYKVHTQIGCSGYRIDLGIISPDTGSYVLGIECDGAAYHSSVTARDRDKLRQSVLEGLGWRICRVWSTSWWHDKEKTQNKLILEIDEAIALSKKVVIEQTTFALETMEETTYEKNRVAPLDAKTRQSEFSLPYPSVTYSKDSLFTICRNPDKFYEIPTRASIIAQMKHIIRKESPITESLLRRRIVSEWGFNRTGTQILDILKGLYPRELAKSKQGKDLVFWRDGMDISKYQHFRLPQDNSDYRRTIEEIPHHEIKNAMKHIINEYHAFSDEEVLFKETGKLFGFYRITEQSKMHYRAALKLLKADGIIE